MAASPPTIFSPARRLAARRRVARLQQTPDAARFVIEDIAEDTLERVAFLRHEPERALVVGDWSGEAWIINDGLKPGDRVIVDGVMKLGPGAPVQIADAAAPAGGQGAPGAAGKPAEKGDGKASDKGGKASDKGGAKTLDRGGSSASEKVAAKAADKK